MSFEICYSYHSKKDGKYDTENTSEMTKKLGLLLEDISYEKLAATIMGQLARRDILITGVIIYEFVKKEVSFRECNDGRGVVIKGKKYSYGDSTEKLIVEDEAVESGAPTVIHVPASVPVSAPNLGTSNIKPLRFEIFEPHPDFVRGAKKYAFTVGRDYPIFEEKRDTRGDMFGMVYTTIDDKGNKQVMPDKYFVPKVNLGGFGGSNPVDLFNGMNTNENMIDIRRR